MAQNIKFLAAGTGCVALHKERCRLAWAKRPSRGDVLIKIK